MMQAKAVKLVSLGALCVAVGCGGTVTEIDPEGDASGSGSSNNASGNGSSASGSGTGGTGGGTSVSSSSRTSGSTTRSTASSSSSASGTGGTGTGTGTGTTAGSGSVTVTGSATSSAGGVNGATFTTVTGTTFGGVSVTGAGGTGVTVTSSTSGSGGSGGYPIPDECVTDYRSEGNDWCEMGLQCSNEWIWAYCNAYSSTNWECSCETEDYWQQYILTGVGDSQACPLAASLCLDPDQVEFSGPLECEPVYQEQQSDYCSYELQCTQSEQISENITAERREWQWIYCYGSGGGFQCDCSTEGGNISLTIEDVGDSSSLCPDMLEVCNSGDLQGEGPKTCEPRSQFSQQGSCSAEQQCTQEASVDGANVLVNSYISTDCREATAGLWDCDCYTAPGSTSFTINSTDSWQACSEASDACAVAAGAQ